MLCSFDVNQQVLIPRHETLVKRDSQLRGSSPAAALLLAGAAVAASFVRPLHAAAAPAHEPALTEPTLLEEAA